MLMSFFMVVMAIVLFFYSLLEDKKEVVVVENNATAIAMVAQEKIDQLDAPITIEKKPIKVGVNKGEL